MKLSSRSFTEQQFIPSRYAFCRIAETAHVALAENVNPHLAWEGAPEGTRSFVVICRDPVVPSKPDDVNQEGREVPADLPRVDFYHWVLVDLAPTVNEIVEGSFSQNITPRGKGGPLAPNDTRQGINDYTHWFAADRDMSGDYFGYDGPCPPWNDALVHRYVFTVYALDIYTVPLEGKLPGADVLAAIQGHVLGQASLTGRYTLNPRLAG